MSTSEVLEQIDGALSDWSVGPDAMRCNAPDDAVPVAPPRFATLLIHVNIQPFVESMNRAMESVARILATTSGPALRALMAQLDGYDVHHPRPLRIDGHAYRRRTLSRRGRRR